MVFPLIISFHNILDEVTEDWVQVKLELKGSASLTDPFVRTGWNGKVGNDRLDKNRIRQFIIELSIDGCEFIKETVAMVANRVHCLTIHPSRLCSERYWFHVRWEDAH